ELGVDPGLALGELPRDGREAGLELGVLRLARERLGPVEGQVVVTPAVVDLADLAGRRLVVLEELADRLVERLAEDRRLLVLLRRRDVLEAGRERRELAE